MSDSNKFDNKRGAHCSIIVTTESDKSQTLTAHSCNAVTNYEWSCSLNDDSKERIPTYTMHILNSDCFRRNAEECNEGETSESCSGAAEEKVNQGEWETDLLLSVLKEKKKSLPNGTFSVNNHILINNERVKFYILPLIREKELDKAASDHAKHMAAIKHCAHSDIKHLLSKISDLIPGQRIGENISCGKSVQAIHDKIIKNPNYIADKNNMYDRRFSSFGIGTATSIEGEVYICQIYKG